MTSENWRGDMTADWEHDLLDTVQVRRSTLQALIDDACRCHAAREGRPHDMPNVCAWCDLVTAMQATPALEMTLEEMNARDEARYRQVREEIRRGRGLT